MRTRRRESSAIFLLFLKFLRAERFRLRRIHSLSPGILPAASSALNQHS